MLERHVNVHFTFRDLRDHVYREKEMSFSQPDEAARPYHQHAHFSLLFVDEEIGDVPDLLAVPIDDFAIANVLALVCEHEIRIAQSLKF